MSNSPLVNHTNISPNSSNPRKGTIKKITIHHMAGNLSVESCGKVFESSSRNASSNYGIGSDGRVGMYVEEKNRSWASSSSANDNQAVTIEVANSSLGGDWPVGDTAYNKLIELCADICKRNGIKKLSYTGDSSGNLTLHNMFAPTSCPGPYLGKRMAEIATLINKKLDNKESEEEDMDGKTIYERLNEYTATLPVPQWAKAELDEAVKLGVTDGKNPMQLIPRYQAAIMAARAAKKDK